MNLAIPRQVVNLAGSFICGSVQAAQPDFLAIVGVIAGAVSVILAIVAIWLSFALYKLSQKSSQTVLDATTRIESATGELTTLFDRMYSEVWGVARRSYEDMSSALYSRTGTESDVGEERLSRFREELSAAIDDVATRVGTTSEEIRRLQQQFTPALTEKLIDETTHLATDVAAHAIREDILALAAFTREQGGTLTASKIVNTLSPQYDDRDIVRILDELHRGGVVMWSTHYLSPNTEVVMPEPTE